MPEVSYSQLLNQYHTAISKAQNYQEELAKKKEQWEKREREFNEQEKDIITKIMNKYGEQVDFSNAKTYDAVGCDYCNNTGYYGRIGIFEILNITEDIRELIVQSASSMEIRKRALEEGYRPLAVDGIKKVLNGITTLGELNNKILMY